ncbi:MAG: MauE/DoxX family redox-associated membrane protein [Acidimicrobiales bacterium]
MSIAASTLLIGLGLAFLLAGSSKLRTAAGFSRTLARLPLTGLLPPSLRQTAATLLGAAEATLGCLDLMSFHPEASAIATTCVLVPLVLMSILAQITGVDAECNCFGILSRSRFGPMQTGKSVLLLGCGTAAAMMGPLPQDEPLYAFALILLPAAGLAWASLQAGITRAAVLAFSERTQ